VVTSRVLYQNMLVDNSPTVSFAVSGGSVANQPAIISTPQAVKQGWATGTPGGTYTGIIDRLYRVEIHNQGSGAFGSAQWRWTDDASANPIVWNASNLTTQNGVAVALNNGLSWTFAQAGTATPQFQLDDYWLFQVTLKYGYQKGLDGTRDHEFRSGTMPAVSTFELRAQFSSSVQPTAFALMDHNIPSNATVSLKAKAGAFTDPPTATIPVTWNSGRMMALLTSAAFTHWRICVTLGGTSLTYLRWSNIFLGATLTFLKQFSSGFRRGHQRLGAVDVETSRRGPGPYMPSAEVFSLPYHRLTSADQATMRTLWAWTNNEVNRLQRPFYVLLRDDVLSDFALCNWTNDMILNHTYLDRYDIEPEWSELVRSIAS
jgi:hypothetical protein